MRVPIFAMFRRAHFSSQRMNHELQSVADAEHRYSQLKYTRIGYGRVFVVNRARATGKNDADRMLISYLLNAGVARENYGIDVLFADSAGDQLRILRPKIEDNDRLSFHG